MVGEPDGEDAVGDVDVDDVAVLKQGDRPADGGLGADMADRGTGGAAGEPAVGDQGAVFAQADTLDGRGGGEHLLHAGPSLGPFVADHDDVARLDLVEDDAVIGVDFALEDHGRTRMLEHLGATPAVLTTAPLGARLPESIVRPPVFE